MNEDRIAKIIAVTLMLSRYSKEPLRKEDTATHTDTATMQESTAERAEPARS